MQIYKSYPVLIVAYLFCGSIKYKTNSLRIPSVACNFCYSSGPGLYYISVGRMLSWHAQSPGFDPLHYINPAWCCSPTIPPLDRCKQFRFRRTGVQGHPWLHSGSQASLNWRRPCLKKQTIEMGGLGNKERCMQYIQNFFRKHFHSQT